jgi:hypothetical protein
MCLSCPLYMPHARRSHCSRFDHPDNILYHNAPHCAVSSTPMLRRPCVALTLPQHPILVNFQPKFSPQSEKPNFTPIQNNRQMYSDSVFSHRISYLIRQRNCPLGYHFYSQWVRMHSAGYFTSELSALNMT